MDAIQTLTGCTFGKGNLIHRDYGKNAFTFYNRKTNEGFRAVLRPALLDNDRDERSNLSRRISAGKASPGQEKRMAELKEKLRKRAMNADIEELFSITRIKSAAPRPARILEGRMCENCKEMAMESRIRLLGGQTFCIPCFEKFEQKR